MNPATTMLLAAPAVRGVLLPVPVVALLVVALLALVVFLVRGAAERRELERAVASLEMLNQIDRVLLTERNRRGVLRLVAEAAAQFLGADSGQVALFDPEDEHLVLEAASGPLEPLVGSVVPPEGTTAGWVARHGQPLLVNDVDHDERRFRSLHERLTPAWAALPDPQSIHALAARRPAAVRLSYGVLKHNFSWEPWCAGELYEYLQAHSVLTVIAREDLAWESLAKLLENFPRLRVLLLETGYRAERYLFPLFERHPDLYIDTSMYVAHRQLENLVQKSGPDHLLFGSRLPLYDAGAALAVLAKARISDDARLAIAGGNLRRLLGLPMADS